MSSRDATVVVPPQGVGISDLGRSGRRARREGQSVETTLENEWRIEVDLIVPNYPPFVFREDRYPFIVVEGVSCWHQVANVPSLIRLSDSGANHGATQELAVGHELD